MKNCLAMASVLCLMASGCASSGLMGNNCGDTCHISQSQNAPRPTLFRNACLPCNGGLFKGLFKKDSDCGCATDCDGSGCNICGCDGAGGYGEYGEYAGDGSGMCNGAGGCNGACNGGRRGRERLSQIGDKCHCAVGQIASGMCPHSGGYPESYNFNPGPPTGQVAYPYYTVRGPRDFLQANPTRIGPN